MKNMVIFTQKEKFSRRDCFLHFSVIVLLEIVAKHDDFLIIKHLIAKKF